MLCCFQTGFLSKYLAEVWGCTRSNTGTPAGPIQVHLIIHQFVTSMTSINNDKWHNTQLLWPHWAHRTRWWQEKRFYERWLSMIIIITASNPGLTWFQVLQIQQCVLCFAWNISWKSNEFLRQKPAKRNQCRVKIRLTNLLSSLWHIHTVCVYTTDACTQQGDPFKVHSDDTQWLC